MTGNTPFVTAPAQGKVNPGSHNNTFSLKIISIATSETPATVPLDKGKFGENDAQEKPQGPPIKAVLLTTLPLHAPNLGVFRSYVTLSFVRNRLMQSFPSATPFTFCNEEGAATQDDLSLNAYFALLKRQPTLQDTTFNVYVTSSGPPAIQASTYFAALLKKPFLLKFLRVIDSQRSNIETSLDSGAFKGKNAADTTLHTLRGVVKSMSVDSGQDIFCLPDGTPVQDNVSLLQYLVMVNPTISGAEKIPSVPVFLKKTGLLAIQSTQGVTSGSPGFIPGSGRPYGDPNGGAPGQWATGIDQSVISKLGSLDMSFTDRSAQELHRDKTDLQATEMLHEKDHAGAAGALPNIHKLSETEWDMILKNGNAFCGWIIDFDGNKIRRAPHAAFRLRKGLNLEKVNVKVEKVSTPTPSATDKKQDQEHSESGSDDKDPKSKAKEDSAAPTPDEMKEYMPRKAHGIPNFMVNDDSSIEVAAVRHAFSQSMAENHFDKTTFDFEASGGFRGITAGAQGGVAAQHGLGQAEATKGAETSLVATYKIPRVTVYLPAEDLEVTDEFAAAVEKIRKTRNLYDLRKLHQMFGQVFCSEIVLGGCLQTSKTLDAKEQEKESMARSEFKASVGLAVGFRQIASGSVKASHENQSHQEQGNKDTKQVEHLSFNATGGNTILAADPPAWLTSVGSDVNSWRVIQQSQLTAVMDVVSAIPHYEEVNKWFLQAVPKLTDYVIIPQNRTVNARFKVMFTLEGLSRALAGLKVGKDGQESKNEDVGISKGSDSGAIQTYLAHQPEKPPIYVRTFVKKYDEKPMIVPSPPRWEGGRMKVDATAEIYQTTKTTTHAIFQPPSTQAPVLINPRALKPLPPKADSKGKPSPATIDGRTVWAIEVPEGYSLTHESLVTIKSQASSTPGTSLTLSVYRNSQGVFMPAITNQPDPVYWRVLKVNAKTGGKDANQLKYGDPIRLCWRFSDQTSGWRDYVDDYYGRRRFDRPAELGKNEDALYLKAPFPRFEALDDPQGMSLVLSSAVTKDPILTKLKLREPSAPGGSEQVAYNLFDLTFRLDFVPANGQVEAYEYMDVVREDDTYASLTELRTKYKVPVAQPEDDIGHQVISHVTNTFVKQFDNIVNAVRHGSPGDVLKETFKGAMMVNPVGFLTKLAGFW